MRVPDRIRTAVRLRLEMLAPVMGAQPRALAHMRASVLHPRGPAQSNVSSVM